MKEKDKDKNEEIHSRREFFKHAAKKALPIVGLLAASNTIFAQDTIKTKQKGCEESSCSSTCTSTCKGLCAVACEGTCRGTCRGTCYAACKGTCWGCGGTCNGTCKGCFGTCSGTCKMTSTSTNKTDTIILQKNKVDTIIPQKTDSIIHLNHGK